MTKRLQVFISGTFEDLKEERQAAAEAILRKRCFPAGMNLFAGPSVDTFESIIKPWINESDVFLLLVGGRYGAIHPKTNKSYTHMEWDYAKSLKKCVIICVMGDAMVEEKRNKAQSELPFDQFNALYGGVCIKCC